MRRLIAFGVLTVLALAPLPTAAAQAAPYCQADETPAFDGPLAALHDQLAELMGDPLSCPFVDPSGGGIQQQTTTGLAWVQPDSGATFFSDGQQKWTLSADGTAQRVDQPAVAAPAATATPAPTPEPTYATRNGPKTAAQLHDELAQAGYAGPWDVNAMLAAYNAAGSQPPAASSPASPPPPAAVAPAAPQPKHDYSADCEAYANTLPGRIGNKVLLLSNIVLNCTSLANHDGAAGLQCYEQVLQKEMADAIIYTGPDFLSRYDDCLAKR
jgi:hypothetical protein